MCDITHRQVDVDVVLKACNKYMEDRAQYILRSREKCIEREMKPKLFGLIKGKTREQAIESLGFDLFNDYNLVTLYCGGEAHRIKNIAFLCTIPGRESIHLSADDAVALEGFI